MHQIPNWQWKLNRISGALFVLLLPFSFFFPAGESAAPEILPIYGVPGLYLTDAAAALMIISGVLALLNRKGSRRLTVSSRAIPYLPLLLIPLLGLVTTPWAINRQLALYTALRWLLALAVFIAWQVMEIDTRELTRVFIIGLALQAVIGILQVINRGPLGLPAEMALSIDRPRAAVLWLSDAAWLRAYGMTFHPNVLGGFLVVGLILGLQELKHWWGRILWWLMAAGLVVTFSRSAWLAAALIILPLSVWLYRQIPDLRKSLLITFGALAVIGAIGAALLAAPILSRFEVFASASEYTSISARGELLTLALQAVRQHPLTGIGAGNFPLLALQSNVHDAAHSVHNVALLLGAEIGAVGIVLWYGLWLSPALALGKPSRAVTPGLLSLTAAWLAVGLIALWDSYPWSLEAGRILSVTLLAWIYRGGNQTSLSNSFGETQTASSSAVNEKKG